MPEAAKKALDGMLAEGVEAPEVLKKLSEAGFDIKPPEGDPSYGGEPGMVVAIGMEEPEEAQPPEPPKGGPQDPENRYAKAAKSAMKKHGYADEDEEPEPEGP